MIAKPPVAYSQRYYEKTLLSANRFLGLPNPVWSSIITLMLGLTGWFASGLELSKYISEYTVWLVGVAILIWVLLKCITPSRRRLKQAALEEHQAEVLQVARQYGIDPTSVRFVDSEEERQEVECGPLPMTAKLP
ncbi:hypothetical protein SAMN02745148_03427 [Modicisalibacter ilicicola DSM 19980]|uniref:Uncharacterized protein n=1 Tax=Modicisalibacter ilicicola DSM 19980 TaxID=1121942 RepID=A0A1M5E4H0_9GAMM|nr:hypothetical protein [Halomonas ilicicola]SHF74127.1 hypothetical protein SAMN02745148_03427 [Halomonas ilicicola DSM 19980]